MPPVARDLGALLTQVALLLFLVGAALWFLEAAVADLRAGRLSGAVSGVLVVLLTGAAVAVFAPRWLSAETGDTGRGLGPASSAEEGKQGDIDE